MTPPTLAKRIARVKTRYYPFGPNGYRQLSGFLLTTGRWCSSAYAGSQCWEAVS